MKSYIAGLVASLVLTVACNGESTPPNLQARLCAQRDSVQATLPSNTLDDEFELIAHLLPGGFGGLTSSYLYLKQPAVSDSARVIAQLLRTCPSDPQQLQILWGLAATVPVRQAQFDWIELRRWYAILLNTGSSDLVSADINEALNRLSFTFKTSAGIDAFKARAQALGVPADALTLSVSAPIAG